MRSRTNFRHKAEQLVQNQRRISCPAISLATHLGTCSKLELPLVLVLLTPLKLAGLKGFTTHNDLETCMFIRSACNTLKFSFGDRGFAAEAVTSSQNKESKDQSTPHSEYQ